MVSFVQSFIDPNPQSRACQRSHWQSHKLICESNYLILLTLKWLGPEIETAFNSFAKFSRNISGYLEKPAISALELWKDKGRVGESLCMSVFFRIVERSVFFFLQCRSSCVLTPRLWKEDDFPKWYNKKWV
jgi:hypothetical protein